jgi:hypothetical protein
MTRTGRQSIGEHRQIGRVHETCNTGSRRVSDFPSAPWRHARLPQDLGPPVDALCERERAVLGLSVEKHVKIIFKKLQLPDAPDGLPRIQVTVRKRPGSGAIRTAQFLRRSGC